MLTTVSAEIRCLTIPKNIEVIRGDPMSKTAGAPAGYDARLSIVVTRPLVAAVASGAGKSMQSLNSYVRSALLAKLKADGIALPKETEAA
jgi:hypothetical protein